VAAKDLLWSSLAIFSIDGYAEILVSGKGPAAECDL
jgi:hypothetical protein